MFLTVKSLSINSHWFHLGRLSMIRLISGQRVWGGKLLAFHFTSAWLAVIKIYIIDNYNKYSKYNRIRCNNGEKKNKNKHLCDYGTRVDKYILRKFLPQTSEADSFFFFLITTWFWCSSISWIRHNSIHMSFCALLST